VSAAIGSAICLTVSYRFFDGMYHSAYSLLPLDVLFDLEALLVTTVLPIIAMLIINLFFLWRRLSLMPVQFLRGELRRNRAKRALRLPDLAFIKRFRLRIILSNKGSYLMLLVGIFFANFILMMGLVLQPTIHGYLDTIEGDAVASYQYILKTPGSPPEHQQKNAERFSIRAAEFYDEGIGQSFEVSLLGISEQSAYLPGLELPSDGVHVSESLWKKYDLRKGDELLLTDCATNKSYTVVVSGSYHYAAGYAVFMPIDKLNSLVGNPDGFWNGWFSDTPLSLDENLVATVVTPEILRGMGEQMLTTFSKMISLCLLAAVVVNLALFILLTKLIVDKNAHNISLMKILGYRPRELGSIFLNTTTLLVALFLVATLPLAKAGITTLYQEMMFRKVNGFMDILAPWWVYTIMVALGLMSYLVVNLLNVRRVKNIPMEQALKAKE
jgi:putative ABC transport system permease protein